MGCSSGPDVVEDGLMFFVDAGSKRSYPGTGTTWTDMVSGNGGGLNNMDASNFSNDYGGVFNFDGTNETVHFGNIGAMPDDGCISFWMYSTSVQNYRNILHTSYATNGNAGVRFEQYDNYGGNAFGVIKGNDSGTYDFLQYSTDGLVNGLLSENTWYNMAATWSKSNNRMTGYMNGFKSASISTNSSRWATSFGSFYIGVGYNSTRHFQGKISNVSCYSKELTADEVRKNYLSTKERYE